MHSALIGFNGVIGQHLCRNVQLDFYFNSKNLNEILKNNYDIIFCAAPSGNKTFSNQNPDLDFRNIEKMIFILSKVKTNRFVLISTVDSLVQTPVAYGKNRKLLEEFVKQKFLKHNIIRLSSLISNHIQKNLLYDIKNSTWISSIDLDAKLQWYPLDHLTNDIKYVIDNNIREINLVSEPILNLDIVSEFAPQHIALITKKQNSVAYNIQPYRYTKNEIFSLIKKYMETI
jgi:hypothetical protein